MELFRLRVYETRGERGGVPTAQRSPAQQPNLPHRTVRDQNGMFHMTHATGKASHHGMVYGMVWYGTVYDMVWCGMVWSDMVWYGMVWYGMAWYGMVWYGMVWYGMVCYGMVWYGMVWYGMLWYVMVWYGMVWYCTVWYGMVWYGMVCYGMLWYGPVWYGDMVWYAKIRRKQNHSTAQNSAIHSTADNTINIMYLVPGTAVGRSRMAWRHGTAKTYNARWPGGMAQLAAWHSKNIQCQQ